MLIAIVSIDVSMPARFAQEGNDDCLGLNVRGSLGRDDPLENFSMRLSGQPRLRHVILYIGVVFLLFPMLEGGESRCVLDFIKN